MQYRTISRLVYLKKARHRHGHGIHSPFLFQLITQVLEDRRRYSEYKLFKKLKIKALYLLVNFRDLSLTDIYHQFKLRDSKPRKLYRSVEMPLRYSKAVFRLIREFKPAAIISYGPTFGVNLAVMAIANNGNPVYQSINESNFGLIYREMLLDSTISTIQFFPENSIPTVIPEFVIINYSNNPSLAQDIVQKYLINHSDNMILIINGIHESIAIEAIWRQMISNECVRVSLDLFQIGIALFHKRLQKESFIVRY